MTTQPTLDKPFSEKRKYRRVKSRLKVTWFRGTGPVDGFAINISADGLFLEIPDCPIEPNTLMRLRITLPGGSVKAIGVSRFIGDTATGSGVGVLLRAMASDDRVRWLNFYQDLLDVEDHTSRKAVVAVL